jgi:CRISPR-associated protein (TIGR03986 family)
MITAPYNFVPLNKEVFYPDWSEDVSHDIPFKDGESGVIELKITAESPIFVRDSEHGEKFCQYNNKEYIPGSSIKGSIRTVMDVLSYGKLKLQDKRLSYRDLNHPSYEKKAMNGDKIHMGWLREKNKTWHIEDLGTVSASESRIKYLEMEGYLDKSLVSKIRNKSQAYEKYFVVKDRKKLETEDGTIVFTGTVGKKKTREFFFPKQVKQELQVPKEVVKTFKQAYYIDGVEENENWKKLWGKELRKGEKIPVFFQTKKEDGKDIIMHFGLSMLYKLPYENTILETLKSTQDYREKEADLCETIFGYVEKDNALKGRVQFSHFTIEDKVTLNKKATLPLSSPRPTFFPAYLEQNATNNKVKGDYLTYDNKKAVLRGFKFYPPRKNAIFQTDICKKHPKVCTTFYPLDKGSTFTGKVRFFNLKKCELGALLASLTFMGKEGCFHKIGMAKPFGFGTVKFLVSDIRDIQNEPIDVKSTIDLFIEEMKKSMNVNLQTDKRFEALSILTSYGIADKTLEYMDIKGFVFAKKPFNKFVLPQVFSLKPAHAQNTEVYTMAQIAKEVSATVDEVIAFSVGLHFGKLHRASVLKPQQAIDLMNRMKRSKTDKSVPAPVQQGEPDGISKTKLRKAISAYWQRVFNTTYHRNQIKEFFSETGFVTTPEEQRKPYIEQETNIEFKKLCKLIFMLEFGNLDEEKKEGLYRKMTE